MQQYSLADAVMLFCWCVKEGLSLMAFLGHQGPYKLCNHNLYIGLLICKATRKCKILGDKSKSRDSDSW